MTPDARVQYVMAARRRVAAGEKIDADEMRYILAIIGCERRTVSTRKRTGANEPPKQMTIDDLLA